LAASTELPSRAFASSDGEFFFFDGIQFFSADDEAVELHHGGAHHHEREAEHGKDDLESVVKRCQNKPNQWPVP
jgi:hypothetical protein